MSTLTHDQQLSHPVLRSERGLFLHLAPQGLQLRSRFVIDHSSHLPAIEQARTWLREHDIDRLVLHMKDGKRIVSGDVDDTADRPAQPGVIEHIGLISPLRAIVVISAKGWPDGHLINPRIDDVYGVCRNQ